MTEVVARLLESFEALEDFEKRQLVTEILRRTSELDWPPLSDEALVRCADERFADLDREESTDASS